jgi:putative transposase
VAQQLREATPYGAAPKYLIRDNEGKYGTLFDRVAKGTGIEVLKIPYRAPRANAICERFLGSVRRECLDHLLIFTEGQVYRVMAEYVAYLNHARPIKGSGSKFRTAPSLGEPRRARARLLASLSSMGSITIIAELREPTNYSKTIADEGSSRHRAF